VLRRRPLIGEQPGGVANRRRILYVTLRYTALYP